MRSITSKNLTNSKNSKDSRTSIAVTSLTWLKRVPVSPCLALSLAGLLLSPSMVRGQDAASTSPYDQGQSYFKQGQYQQAVKSFLATVAAGKPALMPSTYYYLGCCYQQLKNMPAARQYFAFVRDHYPQSREAALATSIVGAGAAAASGSAAAPPASASASMSGSRSLSASKASATDMASLPDENRFYFKSASNDHMEVQAYLNDRQVTCWFDTGASAHFGKNHLREAGIPEPTGPATTSCSGWAGNSVPAWRMMATVKLGNMKRQVPVTVEENMTLPPLLGQEFVRGYNYEIDHAAGFVTMKKELTSAVTENNLYDVPCTKIRGRDMITIQVNGKSMPVMLDTGASRTIFDPSALAGIGIKVSDDLPSLNMQGVGGSISMRETSMQVRMGPINSTIPVLIGRADGGSAIGQDVLAGHRFTIDESKHLLRFFH